MQQSFYITSAIPYVNAKPHLGHVLEWFQADAIARYQRQLGKAVAFTCGTDENSLKNVQAAEKANKLPQQWLDEYAEIFKQAFDTFDISLTHFRRGSDQEHHWPGVQELWRRCDAAGDIYKKTYTGLYCVGCESFYTPEELTPEGNCPEHLKPPEEVTEENYFFALSKYQQQIRDLIASDSLQVVSNTFKNEMLGFIDQGLQDFSISRSVERGRGVGVPVPDDDSQVMYVWFDALTIYMTSLGWAPTPAQDWEQFWPADVHVIGKGINRFHSVYWIGMLLSAGLPVPKAISVHGYITADGQKMSKSLGNVIDPFELVAEYGLEPVRFYLLKYIQTHADGDFSLDKFKEAYTADLANGVGNLCSRVATLCAKLEVEQTVDLDQYAIAQVGETVTDVTGTTYNQLLANYELSQAAELVFQQVSVADQFLSEQKPWKQEATAATQTLLEATEKIRIIATLLRPFMPDTADSIFRHFTQTQITKLQPLFPRLS